MAIKRPKVLFFTADTSPNSAEITASENYEWANVSFRTAYLSIGIEPCDAVAGTIPPAYADAGYPHADDYKRPRTTADTASSATPPAKPAEPATPSATPPQSAPMSAPPANGWGNPPAKT